MNDYKKIKIYIIVAFLFIALTNSYFSYDQTLIYGARDGSDYYAIAENFFDIKEKNLVFHKAWRFIMPITIGFLSKTLNIEILDMFRIFVFVFSITSILFFCEILKELKLRNNHIFFLTLTVLFNPYFYRYYIANPTMINDLVFVWGSLILSFGILKKKKNNFLRRLHIYYFFSAKFYTFYDRHFDCKNFL